MAHIHSDILGADGIIAKKQEYLLPCSYHFYRNPPQFIKGKAAVLTDSEGKEYIDFFAGVSVMNCGHSNEFINRRVIEQINTLQHTTSIYLTQPVVDLAEKMASILPGNLKRSFFCNSGSEANEGAMLLARVFTEKKEFICLEGSLHGRTMLTSGATGIPMWRTDPFLDELPVHFASDADEVCSILEDRGNHIAALLVEPVQGNGGIRCLDKDFFVKVSPLLKLQNVLLICDEIQSGFARTGKMFAIEHWDVVPDILCGAKALGNGFPIAFFSTNDDIASRFTKPSASTLGGNPVSCQAALAVLDYIDKEGLIRSAEEKGKELMEGLHKLKKSIPFMDSPRGLGLMIGVPLKDWKGRSRSELCDLILEEMKDEGVLLGKNGLDRNVLAFQPPLVIGYEQIETMLQKLRKITEGLI